MTRPTVAEACARAVEAWEAQRPDPSCRACYAVEDAQTREPSAGALVALWGSVEGDPSCDGCHAMMAELSKLADPAGALALAAGREGRESH